MPRLLFLHRTIPTNGTDPHRLVKVSTASGIGQALEDSFDVFPGTDDTLVIPHNILEAVLLSRSKLITGGARLPFPGFVVKLNALERVEGALIAAGVDFSPCTTDELAARIRNAAGNIDDTVATLKYADFAATDAPPEGTSVSDKQLYVLGSGEDTVDISNLLDEQGCLAPFCLMAAWSGSRTTHAQRAKLVRACNSLLAVAVQEHMIFDVDDNGAKAAAVGDVTRGLQLSPRLDSLARAVHDPARDIFERADLVLGDATRKERTLTKRFHLALHFYPRLGAVLVGAPQAELLALVGQLSTGLGVTNPLTSLAAADAVETELGRNGAVAFMNPIGRSGGPTARIAAITDGVRSQRERAAQAPTTAETTTSSRTSSGTVAALLRQNQARLDQELLSVTGRAVVLAVADAGSHQEVIEAVFANPLASLVQVLLSSPATPIATEEPTLRRLAAARNHLARYLGAAVMDDAAGGEGYCVSQSLLTSLRKGDLDSVEWYNELVARRDSILYGTTVADTPVEEALLDPKKRSRLKVATSLLFAALGFSTTQASDTGNLAALVEHVGWLFDNSPPWLDPATMMRKLFSGGLQDITTRFQDMKNSPPGEAYPVNLWPDDAASRAIWIDCCRALQEACRAQRLGTALAQPGHTAPSQALPPAPAALTSSNAATALRALRKQNGFKHLGEKAGKVSATTFTFGTTPVTISRKKIEAAFPEITDRCHCVVAAYSTSAEWRLSYCPFGHLAAHQTLNTGVHAPIQGLTAIGYEEGKKQLAHFA